MSLVRVYIATTAGPVAIQRITEEDADLNSVFCLAGKAVALPISSAYDAFVRNPTGVVQRHFGHGAYRIDVSEKIDEGYSWQLGVFAAHALHRVARLAGPKVQAETIVVATGELDRDLALHPVNGVDEKIQRLQAALQALADDAARLVIAVPHGTDAPWRDAFADARLSAGTAIEIIAAAQADELLSNLNVDLPAREKPATKAVAVEQPKPKSRRGGVLLLAALLALAAMAAAAGGAVYAPEIKSWMASLKAPAKEVAVATPPKEVANEATTETAKLVQAPAPPPDPKPVVETQPLPPPTPNPKPAPTVEATAALPPSPAAQPTAEHVAQSEVDQIPSKPVPPKKPAQAQIQAEAPDSESDRIEEARLPDLTATDVKVSVQELRAPPGRTCAEVRAGRVAPQRVSAERRGTTDRFLPSIQKNLCTVEIMAAGESARTWMFGRYQRWTRGRPDEGDPDKVIDLGPRRESLRWTVDIPDRLRRGAVFRVVVFSTAREFTPSQRVLTQLDRLDPRSERMQRLLERLKRRGVQVTLTQFRVIPERPTRDRRTIPGNFRPQPGSYPPPPRG